MKKLIKLLFPKTYQAIFNDGYYQAYTEYSGDYDNNDDYDYHNYYDEYDYDDYQEQLELQKLHDECYAQTAENEQKVIKPQVPILSVGDKIHLHSRQGMYTVTAVNKYAFAYRTRDSIDDSYADYNDYKCHAGGKWNNKGE